MKIKKNKKGAIDDFGGIVIAGLVMIIFTIFLLVYVGYREESLRSDSIMISNLGEASFSTLSMLEWELESGMKVHEALVKYHEENDLIKFSEELYKELRRQDLVPEQIWMLVINSPRMSEPLVMDTSQEERFTEVSKQRSDELKRNSFVSLPRITMPDGGRGKIEIIIKQVSQADIDYYKQERSLSPGYSPVV